MSTTTASRPPPRNPIVLIPARMASTRLPGKPLADIAGRPMIVHVLERAEAAGLGPVVVACAEPAIADAVEAAGGRAVLTRPDHPSGSDRIFEALQAIDPASRHDAVINLQGDLPTLDPALPAQALALLANPAVDIGTLAAEIVDPAERDDPSVVKAAVSHRRGETHGRALYFTRASRALGRRSALAPYRPLRLPARGTRPLRRAPAEPARAPRASGAAPRARGRDAHRGRVRDTVPLGVDTPAQLEQARASIAGSLE